MIKVYIGEERENNYGTTMRIIAIRNNADIDVQFLDEHKYIKEHVTYSNFNSGGIKNPYDKRVYGIGYIGVGKYVCSKNHYQFPSYATWQAIIERCYVKRKEEYNAYYGKCTVCDEWLCYQNFAEWYENNKFKTDGRLHLDKDILCPDSKLYSPITCLLVPQRINELLTISTKKNDGLPQGIKRYDSGRYNAKYGQNNLGMFNTFEDACNAYALAKKNKIVEVANEYKDRIPEKLYNALLNYKVVINN